MGGAKKWCLLCKVDAGGNYLDDKDKVIAWDSSSTYDLYNRNQAGAATTATPSSKTVWTKVVGKTCNTHRVMKGPVGISLDDCKKEAAKVSAPAFSWGAKKWCLLCKVDAGGNYLDDKDKVIAWDSSSTYDLYNRTQAGAATTTTIPKTTASITTITIPSDDIVVTTSFRGATVNAATTTYVCWSTFATLLVSVLFT